MHNDYKRDTKVDTDVSFARNSDEVQKIVGNLINVRSQINTYAEGADYKNGQTLKEALEEKKKENKITPAKLLSFLFVIPLLLYAKNKGEQDDIQNKIDEEKKMVQSAIDKSIRDEKGDGRMIEEMKKMAKQQKYDIMKGAMKEYSNKFSDSLKDMSKEDLDKLFNNFNNNIQTCQSLDQLNIDTIITSAKNAQVAPAQNTKAAEPAKVNVDTLQVERQMENLTSNRDLDALFAAVQDNMNKNKDVIVDKEQLNALQITNTSPIVHFPNNPSVNFGIKRNIGNDKFVVGRL